MVRTLLLATLAALGAAPALAAEPYEGRWARRPEWCGNRWGPTDDVGRVPITLRARRLEAPTMTCTFRRTTYGSDGFHVAARCEGEGQRSAERFMLHVSGDRLTWIWRGTAQAYRRC